MAAVCSSRRGWGKRCALTQIDVQTGAAAPPVKMANCDLTGFGYTADGRTLFYTAFDPATSLHALMSRDLAPGGTRRSAVLHPVPSAVS